LSDLGEGAIKGGRYRKTSPVWDYEVIGGGELRNGAEVKPLRLKSLAMTNKPNLKGLKPLSNRQPASATPASNEDKPKGQQMKNIAVKLGLAPEASEEQILNAVGKIQTDIANRDTELAKLNDSVIAGEVTALGVTDEAEVKEVTAILKNSGDRAATLKVLKNRFNAASKPDASKTITNRATAKTPNGNPAGKLANREQAQTALVNTIKNSRQCSFEDAWELAKAEKPELFAENETEEQA
jgi:phage I-like protein